MRIRANKSPWGLPIKSTTDGMLLERFLEGYPVKPNAKAQMVNTVPPDVELEERAWLHYYEHMKCPATPQIISLLKLAIIQEDAKK